VHRVGGERLGTISSGETPHPASSAPAGLTLVTFHIEHPEPDEVLVLLQAPGADVNVRPAAGWVDPEGRGWSTGSVTTERIVPILTVSDLPEAIRQHTDVLGLEVVMDIGWVAFLTDNAGHQLGLMTRDATAPVNPDVSVFVDDVDAVHDRAVSAGVEIVHPLSSEDWGVRRFFYRDSSGRVINVGTHT